MSLFRLPEQARADLDAKWESVAADAPPAADRLVAALMDKLGVLCSYAAMGGGRDELQPRMRSLPVGKSVVFYRVMAGGLEVVRVLSGHRDVEGAFGP